MISGFRHSRIQKLYLVGFLAGLHFISAVLIPFFTEWGGITEQQIFHLQAIYMVAVAVAEIPTGFVADKYGRKLSIMLGFLVIAVGFVVYTLHKSFEIFAFGEVIIAIGYALTSGADKALIMDIAREEDPDPFFPSMVYTKYRLCGMFGIMLGGPMGSVIQHYWGLHMPMRLEGVSVLFALVVLLVIKSPLLYTSSGTNPASYDPLTIHSGFKALAKSKALLVMALDKSIVNAVSQMMIWTYQIILREAGVPIGWNGWVHSSFVVIELVHMYAQPKLNRIFGGRRKMMILNGTLPILGFVCAFVVLTLRDEPSSYAWIRIVLAVFAPLITIGFGKSREVYFFYPENLLIRDHERATVNSTIGIISQVMVTLLYLVISTMVEFHLKTIIIILGGILLVWRIFIRLPAIA